MKDGFISATRITQLEATVADYGVKIEERRSELARAEQRIVDTDLRIRSLENEYRQQASDQQKVVSARLAEIEQELRKSDDASARQAIVAPARGVIMVLKFNAPGAVIPPRESVADIVPDDAKLVTEARIRPEDVNRVEAGQDRATSLPYYTVMVEADAASLKIAGELKLQAGMPAEVYITGELRTPLEYLFEPVTQVLRRAGRER
jgi:epimerase transport system membrane fusion protein